ncbi:tetratricopeptide repeat protein [Candidatus Albibeggiatoa sp. nov. BB20]|uniref:tetratricopeptide repeat protein n=1 Tax=Candidatus Albibeggiatoa sp. nov. BB20 TaxID=3162723 RepID=UPI0033658AA8
MPTKQQIEHAFQVFIQKYQSGQIEQAKQAGLQLFSVLPNHPTILRILGIIAILQEQYVHSFELLNKAYSINPNDCDLCANLGHAHRALNQFDKAIFYYEKATKLCPENTEHHQKLTLTQQEVAISKINIPIQRKALKVINKPDRFKLQQKQNNKPINIIYFHVDSKKTPAFGKKTDYKSIIYNSAHVARHFMPQGKIFLYTDEATIFDESRMSAIDELVRCDVNSEHPMYERMRLRHEYLKSDQFNADTVFIDADIIFNQDISTIFNDDFDIGVTFRLYPIMPYNEGVIFAKQGMGARRFHDKLLDCFYQLEQEAAVKSYYPKGIRAWRGGQLSLGILINPQIVDILELEHAQLQLDEIKVSLLPSEQYNFTPIKGIEYTPQQLKQKSIMHFKGDTKTNNNNVKSYIEHVLGINWI